MRSNNKYKKSSTGVPFGSKGVFGSILMKYKINQCLVYFWNMVLNLCGYRAGATNKKGFPSGVWTEKWKVLREVDSSSSLAAIVLSRNRDLSNQTQVYHYHHQTCVTATLEVNKEEKQQQPQHTRCRCIWCRQLWKTPHTFTGGTSAASG